MAGFFYRLMGKDVKATSGWFNRLKKREGLKHIKLHGEGEQADKEACQRFLKTWPSLRSKYKDDHL